jgi:hypothetical protein
MPNQYEELFSRHRSARIPALWPWQAEVLESYNRTSGDVAIELPTGTGKTLVGLLVGESYRESGRGPVAYLAGNKQLAQQIERHARELGFPIVRFQGPKDGWERRDVRTFNFGQAIGVMNYWNYFNAKPGVEPAGMLVLDDVHLLEGPLRDMFTVQVSPHEDLCGRILRVVVDRCPYYSIAEDLSNDVEISRPAEMLVFPDSAELASEVRDLLDASIEEGSPRWWSWRRIRTRLEICCWLVSGRGITFTPYIPPSQTIPHFERPQRRLYLSATIGSVDDLQRRLGAPVLTKVSASVQPRQGERLIVMRPGTEPVSPSHIIEELGPFLTKQRKALWLCARKETAASVEASLVLSGLEGPVFHLEADNGADEEFSASDNGHLVTAGRYDGMDFPGDTCRVEVLPEVPVATSDLEEFVSAYLRDAPFAEARLGQRVAQALGRCNRGEDDRSVYLLTDPEFLGRFTQRRTLDAVPGDARDDLYVALELSDYPLSRGLSTAQRFLDGESPERPQAPPRSTPPPESSTGSLEVEGTLSLWREDYGKAADLFDRAAALLAKTVEHRAFWLSMRALALGLAAGYGDEGAKAGAQAAMQAAATAGATSTFFTRLRLSGARLARDETPFGQSGHDDTFAAWDRLMDRLGSQGPQFDRWADKLIADLNSNSHNVVANAIAQLGTELLGVPSAARRPKSGEEDAYWELQRPPRLIAFEVKLAPEVERVVNKDVEQAEGAAKALETLRRRSTRGLLFTPHGEIDESAARRLDRVRPIHRTVFVGQADQLIGLLREYRRGWTQDARARGAVRQAVQPRLPPADWLWQAIAAGDPWVDKESLAKTWSR